MDIEKEVQRLKTQIDDLKKSNRLLFKQVKFHSRISLINAIAILLLGINLLRIVFQW